MNLRYDGIGRHRRVIPTTPTSAIPGTEEKIKVLEKRVERGEELFHQLDYCPIIRVRWNGEEIEGVKPE